MIGNEEMSRYSRNIAVDGIGAEGQRRLLGSSVLVVGCGALGSVVAMYLAGAGVGRIGLADFDTIDISNLQRQLFFGEADAGHPKADTLAAAVQRLNSQIKVTAHRALVTSATAESLFSGYDFVVDATDNPDSKRMVDSVCEMLGMPCCIGGVSGFEGQVMTCVPGSERWSSLFPEAGSTGFTPCSVGGVIGPAAGVVASVQASEVIKHLVGGLPTLAGKFLTFSLLDDNFRKFSF